MQVTIDGKATNFDPLGYEVENILKETYPIRDRELMILNNDLELLQE